MEEQCLDLGSSPPSSTRRARVTTRPPRGPTQSPRSTPWPFSGKSAEPGPTGRVPRGQGSRGAGPWGCRCLGAISSSSPASGVPAPPGPAARPWPWTPSPWAFWDTWVMDDDSPALMVRGSVAHGSAPGTQRPSDGAFTGRSLCRTPSPPPPVPWSLRQPAWPQGSIRAGTSSHWTPSPTRSPHPPGVSAGRSLGLQSLPNFGEAPASVTPIALCRSHFISRPRAAWTAGSAVPRSLSLARSLGLTRLLGPPRCSICKWPCTWAAERAAGGLVMQI